MSSVELEHLIEVEKKDKQFYGKWVQSSQRTWDLSQIITMITMFVCMFLLSFGIYFIPYYVLIPSVILIILCAVLLGDQIKRKGERFIVGRMVLELEITDLYGGYKYMGTKVLKDRPRLLNHPSFIDYYEESMKSNEKNNNEKKNDENKEKENEINKEGQDFFHKIKSMELLDKIEQVINKYRKDEGYVYQLLFVDGKFMVTWLPCTWNEAFEFTRQDIWLNDMLIKAGVCHGWFQEIGHDDGILRTYPRSTDKITFATDFEQVKAELRSAYIDYSGTLTVAREEVKNLSTQNESLGIMLDATRHLIKESFVKGAETGASTMGGSINFPKNIGKRLERVKQNVVDHWKWYLILIIVVFITGISLIFMLGMI